ncbi:hypothetical protein CROQUDRAFT_11398, partial [Cronartium quercuum f. sp. fusiforme G11]
ARKACHGQKQSNFNSKTSPSAVKSRLLLELVDCLGCIYAWNHHKQRAVKSRLAEDLGLPPNTVFIFHWSIKDHELSKFCKKKDIHYGTVAVINQKDYSLVTAIHCLPFKHMAQDLKRNFEDCISTSFLISQA